jgi:hypothetical protein
MRTCATRMLWRAQWRGRACTSLSAARHASYRRRCGRRGAAAGCTCVCRSRVKQVETRGGRQALDVCMSVYSGCAKAATHRSHAVSCVCSCSAVRVTVTPPYPTIPSIGPQGRAAYDRGRERVTAPYASSCQLPFLHLSPFHQHWLSARAPTTTRGAWWPAIGFDISDFRLHLRCRLQHRPQYTQRQHHERL